MFQPKISLFPLVKLLSLLYFFFFLSHLGFSKGLQLCFPGGSVVQNLSAKAGDTGDVGLIPGSGRSLEKEMATHFSVLAWRIPGTGEPGGLPSMESHRVGHD